MKKNRIVLLFVAAIGFFYSCDDAIDIKQPGEVNNPEAVYNTIEDLQKGLNGVYGSFSTESTIEFTSVFTDEVAIGLNNGGQGLNDGTYSFQLNAGSDAPASIWGANYTLINFANRILKAAERLEPIQDPADPAFDEDAYYKYRHIIAQLHSIRAFAHFQLLTYFSTDLKDDSALGVIILDFVPNEQYNQFLPRNTNGEVFDFIEEDLAIADENFELFEITNNYTNPNFNNALRARMAAYRGHYTDAITYATAVISSGGYTLANSQAEYVAMWEDTDAQEVIFKLTRVLGDFEIGSYWNSQASDINGSPFFEVGRELYNKYTPGDIRGGTALVDATSKIALDYATTPNYKADDVLVVNKYPGNEDQGSNLLNDIKVFRLSEMFLIRAEAYAGLGVYGGTANSTAGQLRLLRNARFAATQPLPVITTAEQAWKAILDERRKEFAFEGHRYIDIKRLGVLAGNVGIERYSRDCELYNACTLPPTDHRFTMPIPTSELIANPAIRGQQNPGY